MTAARLILLTSNEDASRRKQHVLKETSHVAFPASPSWAFDLSAASTTESESNDNSHKYCVCIKVRYIFFLWATELHCCPKTTKNTSMSDTVALTCSFITMNTHAVVKQYNFKISILNCLWTILMISQNCLSNESSKNANYAPQMWELAAFLCCKLNHLYFTVSWTKQRCLQNMETIFHIL